MELTSRHKAFLVVLGLAGLALAVDRFVLSGEGTSPSKAGASPVEPAPAESKADIPNPKAMASKPTLAARLAALDTGAGQPDARSVEVGNAFVAEWNAPAPVVDAKPETAGARDVGRWLRLTSVVPGRAAVLNGTVLYVGKEHAVPANPDDRSPRTGGPDARATTRLVTLLRAEARQVLVRVGDDEVELSLTDHADLQRVRGLDDPGVVVSPTGSGG